MVAKDCDRWQHLQGNGSGRSWGKMGRRGEQEEGGKELGEAVATLRGGHRCGGGCNKGGRRRRIREDMELGQWLEEKVEGKKNKSRVVL